MTVGTSPFHGGNRGSNPRRDARFRDVYLLKKPEQNDSGFFYVYSCSYPQVHHSKRFILALLEHH